MNEIYKLIEKLCPEGVSYKCFGDVCDYIRGITYNKAQEAKEYDKNTWKVLRANNITLATKTLNFDDIKEVVSTVKVKDSQHLQKGDILICAGSGSKEHIGKVAYIPENLEYIFGGFMAVIRCHKELNSRFLFHILTGSLFSKYLETALNTTTINNLNATIISGFRIPLPPLAVQQEIVRILDSFTELTAELTAELTTELTARRKQYEHYRDELLRSNAPRWEKKVIQRRLSEVADISTGSSNTDDAIENGLYPFYVRSQEPLAKNEYEFDEEAIITAGDGVGVGKVFHYVKGKFALHQRAYRIHPTADTLNGRFLYHYFIAKFPAYIGKQMYQGSVPSIRRPMLNNFEVLIPPIEVQQQIVDILDRFDLICSDLTSGLPAEIAARQKQYEYYRDKLLTFKELDT